MPLGDITLTPHQRTALEYVVQQILDGKTLVALRGLAGTGKTTLIPALQASLAEHKVSSVVGSPTHRAAMILRKKGLDAETVHAHALTPYFDADYRRAAAWLFEDLPVRLGDDTEPHADVEGLPWLVYEAIKPDLERARDLKRRLGRFKPKRLLASLGISGKDHFNGFGPKQGQGVLIIDEASMVGRQMLATCQEAYPQLILIGDPGQLPPVKDEAILSQIEGTDLTEIHRQASDSPIIQLAYKARAGEPFWQTELTASALQQGQAIQVPVRASAEHFLTAPLLVWRNTTRITCTHAIRHALGYDKTTLVVGEPLVCRSTAQEDRVLGFYNNGLYTIVEIDPNNPRRVTLMDMLGDTETILAHMEEVDGDRIDPQAIPFRWGYCLTAHTAQGGEWPTVYISLPDLWLYAGVQRKRGRHEEVAQWTYTAITRAKETLCFLTEHQFLPRTERTCMAKTPSGSPSAPSLQAVTPPADSPVPGFEDDITDPPVPTAVMQAIAEDATGSPPQAPTPAWRDHEALLHGFLGAVEGKLLDMLVDHLKSFDTSATQTMGAMQQWLNVHGAPSEHAQYQLSNVLDKLCRDGMTVRADPYHVRVQALAPQGFPVEIAVAKATVGDLVETLPKLIGWLAQEGFKPVNT